MEETKVEKISNSLYPSSRDKVHTLKRATTPVASSICTLLKWYGSLCELNGYFCEQFGSLLARYALLTIDVCFFVNGLRALLKRERCSLEALIFIEIIVFSICPI